MNRIEEVSLTLLMCGLISSVAPAAPAPAQLTVPNTPVVKAPAHHKSFARTSAVWKEVKPDRTRNLPSGASSPFEGLDPAAVAAAMQQSAASYQASDGGAARLKAGDVAGARGAFQQALTLDPTNREAVYGLARCATASGDTAGALVYYRRVVYRQTRSVLDMDGSGYFETDTSRLMEFALALDRAGQGEEAVSVYDHAAGLLNHEDGKEHNLEADLPEFGGGPNQVPYTPQALEAMIHLAAGIDTFGHEGYGDPEPLAHFKQALALAPDSAAANFYMGKYLYGKSDPGAKAYLEKAVALGDDHTAASAKGFLQFLH